MNSNKRTTFWLVLVVMLCGVLLSSCASTGGAGSEPRVSSYIRTWPLAAEVRNPKDNLYWNADMIKGEYLTDLIISFALIDPKDGTTIYIPELREHDEPMFDNIWEETAKLKAKYPHLKVTVSVGGYGAEGFSDMADDSAKRAAFVANVIAWVKDYDLDGIDIDWEYPVGPEWGQEIKSRPADRANYVKLLKELRAAEDALSTTTGKAHYTLSVAVPASNWYPPANAVMEIARIVDTMKLMAYDYYGGWSKQTGHHANLSNNPNDPDWGGWSTKQAVNAYIAAGVPAKKLSLGVGFYGHAWAGVADGGKNGLYQPYKSLPFEQGTVSWPEIKKMLEPGSGYTRYWDDVAQAPYLYNGDIWVSYTDEEAIHRQAEYVKTVGMNGVFTWEYGHDINGELLQILAESSR